MELVSVLENICSATLIVAGNRCERIDGALPQGVSVGTPEASALNRCAAGIADHSSLEPHFAEGAAGLEIVIAEGAEVEKPVCVRLLEGDCNVTISAGARARAEFIFVCSEARSFNRCVRAAEKASLRIRDIVLNRSQQSAVGSWTKLEGGASVDVVTVELGGSNITMDYSAEFGAAGGELTHAALSVIGGDNRKTFNINVNHAVPECRSDVVMKGVACGDGFGTFNGLVYVAPDAQHTEAYQQSRNMILGDRARIITAPQLEIYADDVKCSHGAAVGQMNDDAVYYMRQRGLSELEARSLQLAGFVNEIIARLGVPELAEVLSADAQMLLNS